MEKLAIIGCGTMGHTIALSAAWAGETVRVYGVNEEDIIKAQKSLQNKCDVLVDTALINQQQRIKILDSIIFTTSIQEAVRDVTFIIEAIPEVLTLKLELYKELEHYVNESVIITSNTSGFTPTKLAEHAKNPERFIVAHYWNPAHLIPLVEVVQGEQTSEETLTRTMDYLNKMNKKAIHVKKEILGFLGNRLQYALFREAQAILAQGAATIEDIDAAVTYSVGRRWPITGPFMTADMGGLDVFSSISNYLFADLSNAPTSGDEIMKLVAEGHLGDKTGKGFYEWDETTSLKMNANREKQLIEFLKMDQQGVQL